MAARFIRRFLIGTRSNRYFRLIRVRTCAGCRRFVDYAARQDVFLGHFVSCREFLTLFRCKGLDRPLVSGQLIRYGNVGDRQVAVVDSRDSVADLFAKCVGLAIGRFGGRLLLNGHMAV